MRPSRTPLRRLLNSIRPVSLIAMAAALAGSAAAQTLPTGGTVAHGTAVIGAASGGQMTVTQSSQRAVINWTDFSIGSGGQVTFSQSSASSAVLNRVTGSQASVLAGSLTANGQVFLVNPNGVEIGTTGSVNASGGFLASSLDVSDSDFMNGTLSFSGASSAGSVVNQGSITSGGFAVLLGTSVSNSGTITVPLGRVGMGAATSATVDLTGDGFLQVVLPADATDAAGTPLVDNSGTITANGGLVMLKASVAANAVRQAVNLSGSIQAQTVSGTSGSIILSANGGGSVTVASTGSLDVSDTSGQSAGAVSLTAGGAMALSGSVNASGTNAGGRVDVTGDTVTLTGATVNATGVNAGGLIRIGGAYKGGAADDGSDAYGYFVTRWGTLPSLATARTVSIDAASSLHADGTAMPVWPDTNLSEFGTGGTIIVFSSQDTSLNTADWRAGGLDGAIAVSSLGTLSNLVFPVHRTQQEFVGDCNVNTQCNSNPMTYFGPDAAEYLFFGAKDLLIAHTGYDSGGLAFINADGLQSTVENAREVSIEASNDLTVVGGFNPQNGGDLQASSPRPGDYLQGTLRDLTFAAGRTLTMNGDIDGSSASLFLYANDPDANGASGLRDTGIANLDLTNSTLDQFPELWPPNARSPLATSLNRDITIALMAGNDDAAGSRIFLAPIDGSPQGGEADAWTDFRNLTIAALGQGSIEFDGDVSGNIDAHGGGAPPYGSITLTGNLIFAADTTIAATNVTWTNQNTATVSGDARGQSGFSANYEFDTVDDNGISTPILSGSVIDTSAIVPTVGSVVLGTASIDGSVTGALTIDQSSDRAVIDWSSFSLGSAGVVTFNQPSATSATLNRVETGAPFSEIDGTIHSNGQVFLINENGITIGATGLIDTRGGFIGSTIDIGNSNFLNNVLQFSGGGGGSVSNAGTISTDSGGLVGLFGASVANSGGITTPSGQIALGAAQAFTLTPAGDALLTLNDVSALATSGGPLIDQTGTLSAPGGRIEARTASPNATLAQTVEFGGTIAATDSVFTTDAVALQADGANATVDGTVTVDSTTGATGGAIELSAGRQLTLTGSLSAQGDTGGRIDATADTLTVTGATINASGVTTGGLIRLGGAYRAGAADDGSPAYAFYAGSFGALPSLATAGTVSVDAQTAVMATGGTGGVLIVDSLTNTSMQAIWNVSSSGGADISSLGTLSALPDFGSLHLNTTGVLTLGAQTIDLTTTPSGTAGVSSIDMGALTAAIPSLNTLYIEASDTLTISGGLSLPGTLGDSEFHAGRGITVTGTLNGGGGQVGLYANDPSANGARLSDRGSGSAFIDLTGATLADYSTTHPGDISLWLEAGNDNAGGGQIRLSPMDGSVLTGSGVASFADLAIEADGDGETLFDGNVTTTAGTGTSKNPRSTLTLTGNLAFAADTTITSANLTWIGAATATVSGVGNGTPDFVASVAMVDNGVVQYRGKLDDGQAAQIALDGLAAFRGTQAVYGAGAGDFANAAFRLINGSLATGDTLGTDLSPGLVTVTTGGVSRFDVGTHGVTETVDTSASSANDKAGYFFWLADPASNAVSITPRPITYTGIDATSTYGTLATVSGSLTGVLSGDTVDPLATLSQNGASATLGARLSAGNYQIDVTSLTGAEAGDYVLATTGNQSGTLTIDPKSVTYNGGNITGTYGTLATLDNALSGVLSGDDVTAALGVKTSSGSSITYTSRTTTGAYTIDATSLSGAEASDYVIDPSVTGTLTIDPKSVTYNGGNITGTYGTLATLDNALSGVLSGDDVTAALGVKTSSGTSITYTSRTTTGAYAIDATSLSGAQASDYVIDPSVTGTLTIDPKTVTYNGGNITGTYGTLATLDNALSGVLSGDDVTAALGVKTGSGTLITYTSRINTGAYTIDAASLSGAQASDYVIDPSVTGTLTIDPKSVTYNGGNITGTYGTLATLDNALSGVLSGDDVTAALGVKNGSGSLITYTSRTNTGAYTIDAASLSGAQASDYVIDPSVTGTLTIDPKTVTYNGGNITGTYGTLATLDNALSGVLSGDDVTAALGVKTGSGISITYTSRTNTGAYTIDAASLSGAQASDYVIDPSVTGTLTIDPKTVTYNGGNITGTYGTLATLDNALSGVLSGDDVTAALGVKTGSGTSITYTSRTTTGAYTIDAASLSGAQASDYVIDPSVTGTLTIDPKTVTYNGGNITGTYGTLATLDNAVSGVLSGDDVTAALGVKNGSGSSITYTSRTNTGAYTIDAASLSGAQASDYVIDPSVTGTLTIDPKSVTYNGGNITGTYGTLATLDNALSGVLSGDDVTAALGVKNGSSSLITYTSRTTTGAYTIDATSLSGAQASDYVIDPSVTGTLTIAPKAISLSSATFSGTYGDSDLQNGHAPANQIGGLFSGVLSGDTVNGVFAVTGALNASGRLAAGTYALTLSSTLTGAQAGDYVVAAGSPTTGVLDVAQKSLTYTVGTATQVYGSTDLPGVTFNGLLSGDQVAGTLTEADGTALTDRTGVGTYNLIVGGLTGRDEGDYTVWLTGSTEGLLQVTPKPLDFDNSFLNQTYGSASGALATMLSGVLSGDVVNGTASVTTQAGAAMTLDGHTNAGTYLAELTGLSGTSAANYMIAAPAQAGETLTVGQKALSLTVAGGSYTYGSPGTVGVLSGVVNGDSVTPVMTVQSVSGLPPYNGTHAFLLTSTDGVNYTLPTTVNADLYYISADGLSGASNANYSLNGSGTQLLTINRRTVTVTMPGSLSYVYGSPAPLATISGFVPGDTSLGANYGGRGTTIDANGNVYLPANSPVQSEEQTLLFTGAGLYNYNLNGYSDPYISLSITPRPLTYVIGSYTSTYGDALSPSVQLSGILFNDAVTASVNVSANGGTSALSNTTNAGSYSLVAGGLGGAAAKNYSIAGSGDTPGQLVISPRSITYAIDALTYDYGDSANFTYSLGNGFTGMGAPIFALTMDPATAATLPAATADVGTYYARVVGIQGSAAGNYLFQPLSLSTGLTTIIPRPVTFNGGLSLVYGNALTSLSPLTVAAGSDGVVTGDILTPAFDFGSINPSSADVGSYAYTVQFGGAKVNDYAISFAGPEQVTITPRPLTVGSFGNPSYQYGTSGGHLIADITSGLIPGDDVAPKATITDTSQSTPVDVSGDAFAAGNGVLALTNADVCNCSWTITGLSGAKAKDYVLSKALSGSFSITPAPVILTAGSATVTYGASTVQAVSAPSTLFTSSNTFIFGDETQVGLVVSGGSAAFTQWAAGGTFSNAEYGSAQQLNAFDNFGATSKTLLDAGTYAYTVTGFSGAKGRDYYIAPGSTVSGTITVNQAPLSFTLPSNLQYGDQTSAHDSAGDCCISVPYTGPFLTETSNTFGADVTLNVALVDSSGLGHFYTPGLEGGTYAVATKLTGAQANDFYATGPSSFTISPAYISYTINAGDTAEYLPGVGVIGQAPVTTITSGVYGNDVVGLGIGLFTGQDLGSRSGLVADPSLATPGWYHYQADALIADPNNYTLAPELYGSGALVQVMAPVDLLFSPFTQAPASATSASQSSSYVAPATTPSSSSSSSSSTASNVLSVIVGIAEGQSVSATGDADTGFSLGGQDVDADATGTAKAGYNILKGDYAKATGTLSVSTSTTQSIDGQDVTIVGDTSATGTASAQSGPLGTKASISGTVQVGVTASTQGTLTGDLSGEGSANAQVLATGNATASLGSDGVTIKAKGGIGYNVSVSGNLTYGNSDASGTVGATVYAPGSLGADVSPTESFDNGTITLGTSFGGGLGVGGVVINVSVSVNTTTVVNAAAQALSGYESGINFISQPKDLGQGAPNFTAIGSALKTEALTINPLSNPTGFVNNLNTLMAGNGTMSAYETLQSAEQTTNLASMSKAATDYNTLQTATIPALTKQGQALLTKLATTPAQFTQQDLQTLYLVQAEQKQTLAQLQSDVSTLGGQAQLTNTGAISITQKAQ